MADIQPTIVNNHGLLSVISQCRLMRRIKFENAAIFNDDFVEMLKPGLFNSILSLEISDCSFELTPVSTAFIADYCRNLREFKFSTEYDTITQDDLIEIVKQVRNGRVFG